jgi:hypothetical protein
MPVCEVCGNDYQRSFEVLAAGSATSSTASSARSTRLALRALRLQGRRPRHRGRGRIYCCAHCARHEGVDGQWITR